MSLTYVRTNFHRQNRCPAVRLPSGSTPILRSDIFAEQGPTPSSARRSLRFPRRPAARPHRCCRPHCGSSHRSVPRRHRLRPRKIRNKCRSSEEFRSQEVTACGGTFPDLATSSYGFDTRIGRCSFGRRKKCFLPPSATGCAPSGHNDPMFRGIRERPCSGLPRSTRPPDFAARRTFCYQLAFVTPGISPLEAISRNWIRLMPNRRM